MKRLAIPKTDLEVSAFCFGAGGVGTDVRDGAADRLITAYLEAGGNFFDTAHVYAAWVAEGVGASERELGASLRRLGAWSRAVVATKGGHPAFGEWYPRPDAYLTESVIASDLDESLERLGVTSVDLYYLHRDDARVPAGEVIEILNKEVARGRIRYLGASNWPPARIAAANEYAAAKGLQGFVASQVQWSLAEPTWEVGPDPTNRYVTAEDAAWYAAEGLPVVAYTATAGGYFADDARGTPMFGKPVNDARRRRARELASQLGCTPTQIALAYLLAQDAAVIPAFSTSNPAHLTEALGAAAVELTPAQARWLRDGD